MKFMSGKLLIFTQSWKQAFKKTRATKNKEYYIPNRKDQKLVFLDYSTLNVLMVATLICDRWSPEKNPNASMRGIYYYFCLQAGFMCYPVSVLGVSKPQSSSELQSPLHKRSKQHSGPQVLTEDAQPCRYYARCITVGGH